MTYMPPTVGEPGQLPYERLRKWLANETITFQKVVTGSLQAGQELQSEGFSAGSSGWQITGDGDAEFNDVTIRGDIISSNYVNGTSGYFLDSSAGSADFEGNIEIGGNATISGLLNLNSTGKFQSAGSGNRIIIGDDSDYDAILFWSTLSSAAGSIRAQQDGASGREYLTLRSPMRSANSYGELSIRSEHSDGSGQPYIWVGQGSGAGLNSILFSDDHSSSTSAAIGRLSQRLDGIYWDSGGFTNIMRQGVLKARFGSDTRIDGINDTTTGAAANVFVNSTSGLMARSTSLRKHKSRITYNVDYLAERELKPAKFYRKDDKKWWYGFIAEDLAEEDPLLGEYDDEGELAGYDLREVVAVLAAKVNRLEGMVA